MNDDPTLVIKQAYPDYIFKVGDLMAIEGQNYQYNANGVFTITDSDDEPIDDVVSPSSLKEFFPGKQFTPGDTLNIAGIAYTLTSAGSFIKSAASLIKGIGGLASGSSKIDTPPQYDGPKDARELPGAGTYPNYFAHKTRSGHTLIFDDSEGAESVTIQHRGGSMIQMGPKGLVHIRSQNGRYDITFGENRMKITGAQDITVDGAASLKVTRDYNVTVKGKINFTSNADINFCCNYFNINAKKGINFLADEMSGRIKKNVSLSAQGAMGLWSKSGFGAGSIDDSAIIAAGKSVGIGANGGELAMKSKGKLSLLTKSDEMAFQSGGKMSIKSDSAIAMKADGGKMSMSGSEVAIDSDGEVNIQSGESEAPETATDAKTIVVEKPITAADVAAGFEPGYS